jgi:DNA modification methylase
MVLDPYMGGGTSLVEAFTLGRRSIGSDINELATFVADVKLKGLSEDQIRSVVDWAKNVLRQRATDPASSNTREVRNLDLPSLRWLKKSISIMVDSLGLLDTDRARSFCRCAILNAGQWALNGQRRTVTASEFRLKVASTISEMLIGLSDLESQLADAGTVYEPIVRLNDAEHIASDKVIVGASPVDLVVTSPPYPGIHMLYHRWQVDGRKESDVPYWIANRTDGAGNSYYNFADRRRYAETAYYAKAFRAYRSIRKLVKVGGLLIQLVAFSEPKRQLPKFLATMEESGFAELRGDERRIWRAVPGRKWHATIKGQTSSSREVVLLHEAC